MDELTRAITNAEGWVRAWNEHGHTTDMSGILLRLASAARLLQEVERRAPDIVGAARQAMAEKAP